MNKQLNTLLFFIGAALVNLILMFFYFLLFLGIAGIIFPVRMGFFATALWVILFAGSVVACLFTYRGFFNLFVQHVDVEKYFEGKLFKRK